MSAESDLLRVVLALQSGFVTKDQVVEAGTIWAGDRKKPLSDVLMDKGFLDGRPSEDDLPKALGKSIDEIEKDLKAYMRGRIGS